MVQMNSAMLDGAALSNTLSNATLPRLVTGLLMLLAVSLELDSNGAES